MSFATPCYPNVKNRPRNLFSIKSSFWIVLLFLLTSLLPGSAFAQSANAKGASITVTQWQRQEDYIEPHLPGRQLTEMKKTVSTLASWLQQGAPDPSGCTPAWCGAYYSNKGSVLPLFKYELRTGYFTGGMGQLGSDAGREGRFSITANDLSALGQTFSLNGTDYVSVRPMRACYQGILYNEWASLQEDSSLGARQTRVWLITYADSLPFVYMNRKEYLELAQKEVAANKAALKADLQMRIPVKSGPEEEADKARELQSMAQTYSGSTLANMQRRFLANYKPDSVYFKEVFSKQSAPFDADSLLMDSLLTKTSADYLTKPAYVSGPATSFRDFGDSLPDSRMLLKWNLNYFSKSVSLAKAQFLVASWQYDTTDAVAANLDRELQSKLSFCDLAGLLEK